MRCCLWYKLSREGRSDDLSECDPSHGSRRATSMICANNEALVARTMGSKKESLANACFFGLLMLYYEHSRLNGLGSPFGFETPVYLQTLLIEDHG